MIDNRAVDGNGAPDVLRQSRGDATRQAILDAAEQVFAELGYAGARLDQVALRVGIRRPSIIYYFAGKKELYNEVEARIFQSMNKFVSDRLANAETPDERLVGIIDAWLDFLVGRPTAARIILRLAADNGPNGPRYDNPVRNSETALQMLEKALADGIASQAFRPMPASHLLNSITVGAVFYVCNARQLGEGREYDPADPAELESFRALQHKLALAAVKD